MFEYAQGRFVNPKKIITANIYRKDEKDQGGQATGGQLIRVAMDLDVKESSKSVIYSDVMPDVNAAVAFINRVNTALQAV